MFAPASLGRAARAWKSTSVSLLVLDIVAVVALLFVLGWRLEVRSSQRMAHSSAAAGAAHLPVRTAHRDAVSRSLTRVPGAPDIMYLVASREDAVELRRLLTGWEIPVRPDSGSWLPTFDIVIISAAVDEAHLAKLLYAGEHPRPDSKVIDLRLKPPPARSAGVYQLAAE